MHQAENSRFDAVGFFSDTRTRMQSNLRETNLQRFGLACLVGIVFGILCLISPLAALALAAGIVILVLALPKPMILCYLLVAVTVLSSGMERGRLLPLFMPNEIVLLLSVGIAAMVILSDNGKKIHLPGYFYLAFIFLAGGTVFVPILAYLFQGTQLTVNNAFKMVAPVQYFLLFWLFAVLPKSAKERRWLIYWMLGWGLVVALIGLLQALNIGFVENILQNFYGSTHESMAARAGRVTSLLGAWNALGIFMMMIIIVGWSILPEIKQLGGRILLITTLALCFLCLAVSGSYAGVIGLIIGIALIEIMGKRRGGPDPLIILLGAGIAIAIFLFFPYLQPLLEKRFDYQYRLGGLVPQTMLYRIKVWQEIFIPAIRQHFPWAVYPTVPSYYAWKFEESQYILLLFRTGLSGLLGHLAWVVATIVWLFRAHRQRDSFSNAVATAALSVVIVLSIAGFTNEVFSFAGSIDYLWIMLALVANSKEITA